jgi:hypothetical protein
VHRQPRGTKWVTLRFQSATGINDILSSILPKAHELKNVRAYPNTYRIVSALDKVVRVFDGTQPQCRVSYELPNGVSVLYFSGGQHDTYFIGSKTVMQFNHPNVISICTGRCEHLIRQVTCHSITNRVHGTASPERIRTVRRETNRYHLDGLILELMSAHKGLARNNTTSSTILYDRVTVIGTSISKFCKLNIEKSRLD